ncbi:glucose-6-phosphate isomerase [Paenisporosarcina indica]|uniref:glucose-6-phosphate isomerase n=1 Tax=Paenisporosarcina indica TaxID=650093 RepID=UPI0009503580|nr:glucose-6-phosphate isomerase [Paenisporosarcina indica]
MTIKLDTQFLKLDYQKYDKIDLVPVIHTMIHEHTGEGSDYLGWLDWASRVDERFFQEIEETAKRIQENSNVLVVIGIGGSYLGSKAIIEMLKPHFPEDNQTEVIYAGQHVSGSYLKQLMKYLDSKEVTLNVISKSGTTTEPAIAFRVLRQYMEDRYGFEAKSRIIATTDGESGALLELAAQNGYQRFVIPSDIGGRYSVFTAVGMLPVAVAGLSFRDLLDGAKNAELELNEADIEKNVAYQYAVLRQDFYNNDYSTEILASFEPQLMYLHEWWKQLFGESEGKQQRGIFPASVVYTTDLHSLGQYIQDGKRNIFETMVSFVNKADDFYISEDRQNLDKLNYLCDTSLHDFNKKSLIGSASAHTDGGVPVMHLEIENFDAYHVGYLMYFFMKACTMSAYLMDVNPFDQPGVEFYKKNTYKLLQKNKKQEA